ENGLGDRRQYRAEFREEAEEDHEASGGRHDPSAPYTRQANQADVLTETCVREGVEDSPQRHGQSIRSHRTRDIVLLRFSSNNLRNRKNRPRSLDAGDYHNNEHANYCAQGELWNAELEWHDESECVGFTNLVEIRVTQHPRDECSDDK